MKKQITHYLIPFLLILFFVSCDDAYKQKDTFRWFFVGYDIKSESFHQVGNFYTGRIEMPINDSLKALVYSTFHCDNDFSFDDIVITSIYEFRDSTEKERFKGSPNIDMEPCRDTISDIVRVRKNPSLVGLDSSGYWKVKPIKQ